MGYDIAERLEFTKDLASEAAALALALRQNKSDDFVQSKGIQDFVTFADCEVEKLIRNRIAARFGDEAFLGEEDGRTGEGGDIWVVDPIDGTTNYMHGFADWAVSIAWCIAGEIQLGVLALPDSNCLAWAQKGQGAFLNDQRITVSEVDQIEQSILMLGRSARAPLADYLTLIERTITSGSEYRRNGAAAAGLLAVARGQAEAYYEAHLNAWDAFAALLILSEAGGRYDVDGLEDFLSQGSRVLADNGRMTDALRKIVRID